jgi:hypothetical protein
MWDWHWQPPDYGTRYDYGVLEVHNDMLRRFHTFSCREPREGWIASDIRVPQHRLMPVPTPIPKQRRRADGEIQYTLPPRTELIDQRRWTKPHQAALGAAGETGKWELTRGGIAACWAVEKSGPGDTVVLVGCDMLHAGIAMTLEDGFPADYRQCQSISYPNWESWRRASGPKYGNHDFPAERRLIEHLATGRGVSVQFAQDAWR